MNGDLAGLRILIVEDETIIAMTLEDMVIDFGCTVVGMFARAEHAVARINADGIDCALLDVNLNGETSYPAADALGARDVPFLFLTGYGKAGLDPAYRDRPVVNKPVDPEVLQRTLRSLVAQDYRAR